MKNKYNVLFKDVHLSEEAKQNIKEKAVVLLDDKQKKETAVHPQKYMKVAVLLMALLILGGTGTRAAYHYNKLQHTLADKKADRLQHTLTDKKAEITVQTTESPSKSKNLYDVKLSYLPEGYVQDKTDHYLYQDKNGNGYFSVILYHLQTEYRTERAADNIREFQTPNGQGYYGGRKYGYFAVLTMTDTDYMIYIDSSNMSLKEVKKIAENASLSLVKKESDIQANLIEWTPEKQKETDAFRKKIHENIQ